jgi:hypothetical protein
MMHTIDRTEALKMKSRQVGRREISGLKSINLITGIPASQLITGRADYYCYLQSYCRKGPWSWWNNPLIHCHLFSWARGALIRSGGNVRQINSIKGGNGHRLISLLSLP